MANVSSMTLGTVCVPKMSARRRSCCSLQACPVQDVHKMWGVCIEFGHGGAPHRWSVPLDPPSRHGHQRYGCASSCLMIPQVRGLDSAYGKNVLYTDARDTPDNTCQSLEGLKKLRQSR